MQKNGRKVINKKTSKEKVDSFISNLQLGDSFTIGGNNYKVVSIKSTIKIKNITEEVFYKYDISFYLKYNIWLEINNNKFLQKELEEYFLFQNIFINLESNKITQILNR